MCCLAGAGGEWVDGLEMVDFMCCLVGVGGVGRSGDLHVGCS